jgi:hypothetical protein
MNREHFSVVSTGECISICDISACKNRCIDHAKALLLPAFASSHLPGFTACKRVVKIPCLVAEDQCSPC